MWETEVPAEAVTSHRQARVLGRAAPSRTWPGGGSADRWFPVVVFAVVAGVIVTVSVLAHTYLPQLHVGHRRVQAKGWLGAFGWWDGWWYVGIARWGYFQFGPRMQTPVAFFPAYPLLMRLTARAVADPLLAGVALSLAFGLGSTVAFHRWCVLKVGPARARLAVMLMIAYPFAFYLMGAVYADGLFLCAALLSFLALEGDRPIVAGLAAAVATAARPIGVALVVGLWILRLERSGRFRSSPVGRCDRDRLRPLRLADAGLLVAPLGLVAFCTFLWIRFRHPFAFLESTSAPGWDQPQGFHTWFKVHWIKAMWNGPWTSGHFGHLFVNAAATFVVGAFVPLVFRRFGWGYGVFVTIAVVVTAISTKDFVGMGRYSLAAFPCFAAAADVLFRRPRLTCVVLAVSFVALVMLAQLHARGTIIS